MSDRNGEKPVGRIAPSEIQRFVFGVRYEPQHKLLDRFGTVIDEILRADGTPFGPDTFPVSGADALQYRLLNTETNSSLLINAQDTILQMPVMTRDGSRVNDWARDFEEYVLGPLRRTGGVKNIARYGVLLNFKEQEAALLKNPPVARYLSPDYPKANSLFLAFQPSPAG